MGVSFILGRQGARNKNTITEDGKIPSAKKF